MANNLPNDPLAPTKADEGPGRTDNDSASVKVRGGVELGTMRYVLAIGLVLAIAFMLFAAGIV